MSSEICQCPKCREGIEAPHEYHLEPRRMPCQDCGGSGWVYSDPIDPNSLEPCCEKPHAARGEQSSDPDWELIGYFMEDGGRWLKMDNIYADDPDAVKLYRKRSRGVTTSPDAR